jgi:hypothetical protein
MFTKIIAAISLALLYVVGVSAQESAPNLDTILSEAQKQTELYRETFRDLLAVETKTFAEFDKNGEVDENTLVKSDFLVYQSGKNNKVTTELRNVLEVNEKPVPNSQKRSNEFLAELAKEETLEKELKKIQKEGAKYDKTLEVYGLTLNEGVILAPNLRSSFDFKLVGKENYQSADVFVISYRQTKKSPYVVTDGKESFSDESSLFFDVDIPGSFKKNDVFVNGKLWVDSKTFQIWREEQELVVQAAEPLIALTTDFEYQASDYGILVPKEITVTYFDLKKQKNSEKYGSQKEASVSFEYSKFRQTNVDIKVLDDSQ